MKKSRQLPLTALLVWKRASPPVQPKPHTSCLNLWLRLRDCQARRTFSHEEETRAPRAQRP